MLRKLLIVFASGMILSVVAFSAAWLAGGEDFRREFTENGNWHWTINEDDYDGPRKTRTFAVEPGARLRMDVPVELRFVRGDKAEMTVEGPDKLVDRLSFEEGHLTVEGSGRIQHSVKVRITAPEITGLDLDAPGDVTLSGLDQEEFRLEARGAVDLEANGKVDKVFVKADGAGNLDLRDLEAKDATIRVDGAGNVTVGATNLVDVVVNGVGHVTLVRKPETLRSQINGIGSVDHDY